MRVGGGVVGIFGGNSGCVKLSGLWMGSGQAGKVVTSVLPRDFAAGVPNKRMATDVTEFSICKQKRYFCRTSTFTMER